MTEPRYDWETPEELREQAFTEMYRELVTAADGVYPTISVWNRMSEEEQFYLHELEPDASQTVEDYVDALPPATKHHGQVAAYSDELSDIWGNSGDYDRWYGLIFLNGEKRSMEMLQFIDRYADEITAADGPDEFADNVQDTEYHWSQLYGDKFDGFYENVWEAVTRDLPQIKAMLEEQSDTRKQVDMQIGTTLPAVEDVLRRVQEQDDQRQHETGAIEKDDTSYAS
jgi:hypothetical protein